MCKLNDAIKNQLLCNVLQYIFLNFNVATSKKCFWCKRAGLFVIWSSFVVFTLCQCEVEESQEDDEEEDAEPHDLL